MAAHPLSPMAFTPIWNGVRAPIAAMSPNPPLHAYLLAAAGLPFGAREIPVHLALLPFGLLALAATGMLARRFGVEPISAQLLVATSPGVVVLSQSLMPDLAAVSLGTLGVALSLRAADEDRNGLGVVAGVLLSLAVLLRYNLLIAPFLLLLDAGLRRRCKTPVLLALSVVALAVAAWLLVLRGEAPAQLATTWSLGPARTLAFLGSQAGAALTLLSGATLSALVFAPAFLPSRGWVRASTLVAALALGVVLALRAPAVSGPVARGLALVCAASGVLVVGWTLSRVWVLLRTGARTAGAKSEDLDDGFLALWVLAVVAAPVVYIHVAVKFFLFATPPLVILCLRRCRPQPLWRGAALVVGVCVSVVCARADYVQAGVAPRVADEIVRPLISRGATVWFTPEWGYAYYLERAGASRLHRDARPRAGDLILATVQTPPRGLHRQMGLVTRTRGGLGLSADFGTVLMQGGAGFYSSFFGWLPFSWSRPPVTLETVVLEEVVDTPH